MIMVMLWLRLTLNSILESDPGPITCVASVILQAGNLAHLASSCLDPGLTRDLPASGAARMAEVAGTARISVCGSLLYVRVLIIL